MAHPEPVALWLVLLAIPGLTLCSVSAVALAYQAQLVPSVEMSPHDEAIDVLVTSEGAHVFRDSVS